MKVKDLYNVCLTAVADGLEDFEVVVSEISIIPNTDNEEIDGEIVESFTVVLDKPTVASHINVSGKELRIFDMNNTPELLEAYNEIGDVE